MGSKASPSSLVSQACDIVQSNAYFSDAIDWSFRRVERSDLANRLTGIDDGHEAIQSLLNDLGDRHSHLVNSAMSDVRIESEAPVPSARVIRHAHCKAAYVHVPFHAVNLRVSGIEFAHQLRAALMDLDADDISGRIIDLRDNDGGNMWPMLAGLAPLLDGPLVGRFRTRDGFETDWTIGQSNVQCGYSAVLEMTTAHPVLRHASAPGAQTLISWTPTISSAFTTILPGTVTDWQHPTTRSLGIDSHML